MATEPRTAHAAPMQEGQWRAQGCAGDPGGGVGNGLYVVPSPDWEALADRMQTRRDEIVDLMQLLSEHIDSAAGPEAVADAITWAIACASLGDQHLWQDLQLTSRRELSALFEHWFPSLAAKNTQNMKWKKFLYKQLCLREELLICKAPSCNVCSDYALCFAPEDGLTDQSPHPSAEPNAKHVLQSQFET